MTSGDSLVIGEVRMPSLPLPLPIVLGAAERDHIYQHHPELRGMEHSVVQASRTAGMILMDAMYPSTINIIGRHGYRHHIFMSVELVADEGYGRLKSARFQRTRRTSKMKQRALDRFGPGGVILEGLDE